MTVRCDYCGRDAELVGGEVIYPHRPDLRGRKFWRCEPCGAYVGTHANSLRFAPLGRLANAELRELKQRVHAVFDPLWKEDGLPRTKAYRWLADALDIPVSECHVGMFSEDRCRAALAALATRHPSQLSETP